MTESEVLRSVDQAYALSVAADPVVFKYIEPAATEVFTAIGLRVGDIARSRFSSKF